MIKFYIPINNASMHARDSFKKFRLKAGVTIRAILKKEKLFKDLCKSAGIPDEKLESLIVFESKRSVEEFLKEVRYFKIAYWLESKLVIDTNSLIGIGAKEKRIYKLFSRGKGDQESAYRPVILKSLVKKCKRHYDIMSSDSSDAKKRFEAFYDMLDFAFSIPYPTTKTALYVVALEALLLPGADRELGHQFSFRSAKLLGKSKKQRQEKYKICKKLYRVRSRYLHGEKVKLTRMKKPFEKYWQEKEAISEILRSVYLKLMNNKKIRNLRLSSADSFKAWSDYFL